MCGHVEVVLVKDGIMRSCSGKKDSVRGAVTRMSEGRSEKNMVMLVKNTEFNWEMLSEEYKKYEKLPNEDVMNKMVELCVEHFFELSSTSSFLKEVKPDFWVRVLERLMVENEGRMDVSKHWGSLVFPIFEMIFLRIHDVEKNVFESLVDSRFLPVVDSIDDAWILLGTEQMVVGVEENSLSSLQHRCIDCLAGHWLEVDFKKLLEFEMGSDEEEEEDGIDKNQNEVSGMKKVYLILKGESKKFMLLLLYKTRQCFEKEREKLKQVEERMEEDLEKADEV